ncbi:MAG: PIG-L family deacetylase [Acidimicrobiia bacterium]|nr:PIG-L family deacetylase [Acidimicrobiia bacterium]
MDRRALVISAHPDDIEFGCAGSTCKWVDEGWDVRYVIATSGQKGVQDARQDPEAFGRIREAESRRAAEVVGVTDVTFLRYMDSEVVYGPSLLKDLARQFRRHRPHRLVVMDPQPLPTDMFINHPDHRFVAQASLDMILTGGTTAAIFPELSLEEGLEPWRELEETWIFGPAGGPTAVDITTTVERKLDALQAHVSQVGEWDVRTFVKQRLADAGRPFDYEYAETFRVIARRSPPSNSSGRTEPSETRLTR